MLPALGLILLLAPPPPETCQAGQPLAQVVNAADALVLRGQHRLAIRRCFEPFFDKDEFNSGPPRMQERFLFEYLAAADKAATFLLTEDRKQAEHFYGHAQSAGERYLSWFRSLADVTRLEILRESPGRPSSALFLLSTAFQRLNAYASLLDTLGSVAEFAEFFSTRVLDVWELCLRLQAVDFKPLEPSGETISKRIEADEGYRERWATYQAFLKEVLAKRAGRKEEATRRLRELAKLGLT